MTDPQTHATAMEDEERGFDVLEVLLVLTRRWRLIASITIGCGIAGLLLSFLLQAKYSASVTFLVDQESSNTGLQLFRAADPTVSLLQSKAITEFVLQHIDVNAFAEGNGSKLNDADKRLYLRARVQGETSAQHSDQGLYTVKVQDPSPSRAVAIANGYLDALQELSDRMSFESATRTRSFYQQQVSVEREALERAEAALKVQQEKTGLLQPGSQTTIGISQIATLRSQIVGLEVQRATIAQSATAENPEMVRLNAQIAELQGKVNGLQNKINGATGQDLPSQNMDTLRLQREVTYHENLLTSLATQFERARLQETFGVPRVHVVDRASLPVPKTFPKRLAMTLGLAAVGMFLGLLYTVFTALVAKLHRNPSSSCKLTELKRTFLQRV